MQLTWYGHSCFSLKTDTGKNILFDPIEYPKDSFDNIPNFDIMTLSNMYFSANYSKSNFKNSIIIDRPGLFNINNLQIEGYCSYQDELNGLKRGKNIIYVVSVDNLRICHLGHLGHFLETEFLDTLNNIDILITPIDCNFSLSGYKAAKLSSSLLPKYIIPSFSSNTASPSNDFKEFISLMKNIKKLDCCTLDISNLSFSNYCETLILNPYKN